MHNDDKLLLERCRAACLAVAPRDLEGVGLLIGSMGMIPGFHHARGTLGLTSEGVPSMLKNHVRGYLPDGPNVGIALDLNAIAQCFDDENFESRVVGVALHELAHNLERQLTIKAPHRDPMPAAYLTVERWPIPRDAAPMFLRSASHVALRAKVLGLIADVNHVFGSDTKNDGTEWIGSTGSEIGHFSNDKISAAIRTWPPDEFRARWQCEFPGQDWWSHVV